MPKLSIIVPVYKVEKYIRRCIDSILAQSYKDFELILIDDGSPDNSGEICDNLAKLDNRIRVIHKENGGLSSARNKGIDVAYGEYIGFIDSDDWITEDMYEYLMNLINLYNCEIASVSYILSYGESSFKQTDINVKVYDRNEALKYYMNEGMSNRIADYSACIKIYKKELFNKIRFPHGQLYEDISTNFKLIQSVNKYVKSNKICYFYYQNGTSITRNGFRKKDLDLIKVSDEIVMLSEKDDELLKLANAKKARAYFSLLAKIAVYGFSENLDDKNELIEKLTIQLRSNYTLLLKSNMPISRKVIMSLLCININFINIPINILKVLKII